jgi:hypothetical protein
MPLHYRRIPRLHELIKMAAMLLLLLLLTAAVRGQSALDVFDPNANNAVWVVVQPDGKIRVGVFFTTVSGVARNYIARLNTDATPPSTNANSVVYSIAVQAEGKMLESNHQPSD